MTKEQIIEQLETSLNGHKGLNEAIDDASFYIAAEFDKLKKLDCINCDETKPTHEVSIGVFSEPKQENCCTPIGQIKRYKDCIGCDRKPKQETLEEAAEDFANSKKWMDGGVSEWVQHIFKEGAKWMQERMYSEEEVKQMFNRYNEFIAHHDPKEWQLWIDKQFKKK